MGIIYDTPEIMAKLKEIETAKSLVRKLEDELSELRRELHDKEYAKEIKNAERLTPTRYALLNELIRDSLELRYYTTVRGERNWRTDSSRVNASTADALVKAKCVEIRKSGWKHAVYAVSAKGRKAHEEYKPKMEEK